MIRLFNGFVKLTGWPLAKLVFRTRVYYLTEGAVKRRVKRRIKGPAIIVSNHTSVFDYAVFLFVFFHRTLRYQMAEVLFKKKPLGIFLRLMGGIRVDRGGTDGSFINTSLQVLKKGGVVGIFPEGRLPRQDETAPLPFKPGAAYLSLLSGAPVIPVYTTGGYFRKKRPTVIVGVPVYPEADPGLSEKENTQALTKRLEREILYLRSIADEQK